MEEFAKKEEARGKMRWRKDKEESAWLARVRKNASTLPPTAHCRQNRQAILPYFLPFNPFFLPPPFFLFAVDETHDVHEWCIQGRLNLFEAS